MIIRQTLNFAAHLAAGAAVGALAVIALGACAKAARSRACVSEPLSEPVEPLPTSEPMTT